MELWAKLGARRKKLAAIVTERGPDHTTLSRKLQRAGNPDRRARSTEECPVEEAREIRNQQRQGDPFMAQNN